MKGIIAIVQARVGSTRLPNKILLDLEGKTVLERVIERLGASALIDETVIATTILKEDLKVVKLCSENNIRVYCGSEEDVLDRFFQAAKLLKASHIVRVTSDCPMIDPKVIDRVIERHIRSKSDYTTNTLEETFPDGEDVEVFTFAALKKAWASARLRSEREHVTPYMVNNPRIFKLANVRSDSDLSQKRWTLDEKKDYKFIKLVYRNLYKRKKIFSMDDILKFLEKNPGCEEMNSGIKRNEGYVHSLKKDGAAV